MGDFLANDLIVFIGMPGSGKSTLAKMMAEKLKFDYFETSVLLDEAVNEIRAKSQKLFGIEDEESAKQIKLKEQGLNCENGFVCNIVFRRLLGYKAGTIVCGFPREYEQAIKFVDFVKNAGIGNRLLVVLPKINDKVSFERMAKKDKEAKGDYFVAEKVEVLFQGIKSDFSQVVSVLGKARIRMVYTDGNISPPESFQLLMKNIKKP